MGSKIRSSIASYTSKGAPSKRKHSVLLEWGKVSCEAHSVSFFSCVSESIRLRLLKLHLYLRLGPQGVIMQHPYEINKLSLHDVAL